MRNLFGTELYQLFSENLKERLKLPIKRFKKPSKIELKTEQLHWSEEPEPTMTLLKTSLLESQQQEAQQQLLVEREQIAT